VYRRGVVTEVDPARCRCRVRLPGRGDLETYWLDVLQQGTAANQGYWLPDAGELVAVMLDERDESGCVLGGLYTKQHPPPADDPDLRQVRFADGTVVSYHRATRTLAIHAAGATVQVEAAEVRVDSDAVTIAGARAPVASADRVESALNALKDAVSSAPTAPMDGGSAFKTAIVAALALWPPNVGSDALTSD
jgi:phage baseplate assembly protein V